jgi:hypothetical protein
LLASADLVEALHTQSLKRGDLLLVVLAADVSKPKSVAAIKTAAIDAGCPEVKPWNVSEILKRANGLVIRMPNGWQLTSSGRKHVERLGVLPEPKPSTGGVRVQATQLRAEAARLANADTKAFVDEALSALEAGLFRSSVVLSWAGAMSLMYDAVMANHLADFNREAVRRDAKWKPAVIKDDLARMKESDFLDLIGSPPLSVLSKNVKEELKTSCLALRNACGHPSSLKFGESKVAAHIEVLILNVFGKFS